MTAIAESRLTADRRRSRPVLQPLFLGLSLVVLVPAAVALAATLLLGRPLPWQFARPVVLPHVLIALAMLALGAAQLALPKGDRRHRLIGSAWAVLFAAVCVSGLFVQLEPGHVTVAHMISSGFAIGNLLLVPLIVWAAATHRPRLHRNAVLTAVWFTIQGGALTYIPFRAVGALVFGFFH
jgi:uncharacterized membrane protein